MILNIVYNILYNEKQQPQKPQKQKNIKNKTLKIHQK